MKRVYIATPYGDEDAGVVEGRVKHSERYQAKLIKAGYNAYNPISMHYMVLDNGLDGGFRFFQDINKAEIMLSDEIHVLKQCGYRESVGVGTEIAFGSSFKKKIRYIDPDTFQET